MEQRNTFPIEQGPEPHTLRIRYERATFAGIDVWITTDLADHLRERQLAEAQYQSPEDVQPS